MRMTLSCHLVALALLASWGCSGRPAAVSGNGPAPAPATIALSFQDPDLDKPLPMDPRVTTGTLDNGLTYYIEPNAEPSERVELRLVVRAGSVLEDDDQLGLAHVLEHMAFNGTTHFPANELVNYLESIGTKFGPHLNAYTSYDQTGYLLQVPTDKPELVDKGFLVLSDWAGGMLLEDEEIQKERGVVLEEWRVRRGADMRLMEETVPLVYGERYASRMPIGTEESLQHFEPDALRRFYHTWYRPDLMAVVVVGTVTPEEMIAKVEHYFSGLANPDEERPREMFHIPNHTGTYYHVSIDPEFTTPRAVIAWTQDFRWESTYRGYAESLVRDLFYALLNARLSEVARQPDAAFVRAFGYRSLLNPGKMVHQTAAVLKPNTAEAGVENLLTEVRRVRVHGFTEDELVLAKDRLMKQAKRFYEERDTSTSASAAAEIIRNFTVNEPMPGAEKEWQFHQRYLPQITLADINAYASRWMSSDNRTVIVALSDEEEGEALSEKALRDMVARIDTADVPPRAPAPTVETLLEVLPAPGEVVSEETIDDIGVTVWTLSNGIRVVVKPTDFKNDEVLLRAWHWGGHSVVSDEAFIPATTAPLLTLESGAGPVNRTGLDRFLAGKRANVTPYVNELTEGFKGSASPSDLETMFQLIFLYATSPRFDNDAFDRVVEARKAFVTNRTRRPETRLSDEHTRQLYQDHPRRRPWTMETVNQMSLEASTDTYLDLFSDYAGMTVVLVGNLDLNELKPLVETYLGSLPGDGAETPWQDIGVTFPDHPVSSVVRAGIEPKSFVRLTFFGEAPWSPEAEYVLNSLIDVLRIRAREVIREELSGTYGVWSYGKLSRWPKERYTLSVTWACDPARVDELKTAMDGVLDELRSGPMQETYLTKVKETQRRTFETNLEENRYWLQQLTRVYQHDLDPKTILHYSDMIDALDANKVWEAAKLYLVDERKVETVLYPAEGDQAAQPEKRDETPGEEE